jgi:hypothetical protein
LGRSALRKWRNGGENGGYARYFGSSERFQVKASPALDAGPAPDLIRGGKPVRVNKPRHMMNVESRLDSIEAVKALKHFPLLVMAGLDPAIHVFLAAI